MWTCCYPSEPGLEGELSEEIEVTEATDSGLWEEGMVKERTMECGRGPRRSSAAGWHRREGEEDTQKEFTLKVAFKFSFFIFCFVNSVCSVQM